jgi:hypothetical protein
MKHGEAVVMGAGNPSTTSYALQDSPVRLTSLYIHTKCHLYDPSSFILSLFIIVTFVDHTL